MARSLIYTLAVLGMAAFASIGNTHAAMEKPLVAIDFNQPNVYFDRALTHAVIAAERTKPDVMYRVVSFIPDTGMDQSADENLRAVVQTIYAQGVAPARVEIASQKFSAVQTGSATQKIAIFVQ